MRWFRSNGRATGWLALFALAFQLVVSFGHVHPIGETGRAAAIAAPALSGAGGPGSDKAPAGHDVCAICAVMALTASAALPGAPQPAVTLAAARIDFQPVAFVALRVAAPAAFHARGPPV
jgi:hypothetical protein